MNESELEKVTSPVDRYSQIFQVPMNLSLQHKNYHQRNFHYSGGHSTVMSYDSNVYMDPSLPIITTPNPLNLVNAPSRTVYLGNIPKDLSIEKLLDHVSTGMVENCKILPDNNCAFITFVDEKSALLFHVDSILRRLNINGHDIKIGWGKTNMLDSTIVKRIRFDGATRTVYIGNLNCTDGYTDNESIEGIWDGNRLRKDFERFGTIESLKYLPEKGIAFVYFTSIASAIHAVDTISNQNSLYHNKKVYFGKDRCSYITKIQQYNAAQFLGLDIDDINTIKQLNDRNFITNTLIQQSTAAAAIATSAGGINNLGNRTIYLGNLSKMTKVEDICNIVRGGLLQHIKLIPNKNICFITFVDPTAAAQFYAMVSLHGLTIHKRRCKIGWGKHSGPLSNSISIAVSQGASRNIYIGNIDWHKPYAETFFTEDNLRTIFSKYGEVEQINFLPNKSCCFINFINISNAISAFKEAQKIPEFKNLKINFGKDRCGNIPQQIS